MEYKYDYLVFIGRFQPIHRGHVHVIREALKISKKLIIVLGSHMKACDVRNPFNTEERIELIKSCLTSSEMERIQFAPQYDYTYNDDRWIAAIQSAVNALVIRNYTSDITKIGIVGYNKDHTSYYLKKFPSWEFVPIEPEFVYNSTDFRKAIFENATTNGSKHSRLSILPSKIEAFCENSDHLNLIIKYVSSHFFVNIKEEYDFIKKYKQQWNASPYPVTFNTVDAVIVQSGHVLLVSRKEQPGKDLLALPGGFVNQNETLEEAVLREIYEETKLDIPKPVLKGSLVSRKTFDDPHRSARGRTITEAFYFKLNESHKLPKVKGSDDAKKAFWLAYSEVQKYRNIFMEDHYSIIENMIGI